MPDIHFEKGIAVVLAAVIAATASASGTRAATGSPGSTAAEFGPSAVAGSLADIPVLTAPVASGHDAIQLAFGESITSRVVDLLGETRSECAALGREYRLDCLQQGLRRAARAANRRDYRAARQELNRAANDIKRLVDRNVDRAAPKAGAGRRTYRAVAQSAARQLNRQAAAIIQETETKLLRSAGTSTLRKTHYSRIAQAVGSTKTLLRS